ncbi:MULTISPECIES: hypothetical protein [unclassified Sphingomonas]|uniref:hypothetical protein n=1 Tax=unclassified Sphingomonas TaxID=196159 RepID=UPI001910D788|nr:MULTISPECIES: hypothetical protein [unclassified Sphingomonas]
MSYVPVKGGLEQSFCRVAGFEPNAAFDSVASAAQALLDRSVDGAVNVRSYTPDSPRSREFVYGLTTSDAVVENVSRLAADGLFIIINETVDIQDGGVSGVVQNGIIEFAPDDTPRCVEKPGVASLPFDLGLTLLQRVYGFTPEVAPAGRTEFSIHPRPRGWRQTHTLLWEWEDLPPHDVAPGWRWPNRFSQHVGDKAFGLLMADLVGLPVPRTEVIARRVAPFVFGTPTGSAESWIRTCPRVQEPGLFTTHKGWLDPFRLLADEDPDGDRIASVLRQDAVPATHSGAAIIDANGEIVIEGLSGEGDLFMLGKRTPEALPDAVHTAVTAAQQRAMDVFGPVRLEWVYDGGTVWIVQLHLGATVSTQRVLVPGDRETWVAFEVRDGLEALRDTLAHFDPNQGLELHGDVGLTSHVADLVRKSGIPTRVVAEADA